MPLSHSIAPYYCTATLHRTYYTTPNHTTLTVVYRTALLCTVCTVTYSTCITASYRTTHFHSMNLSPANRRGFPSLFSTKGRGFYLNGSASYTATCTRCDELQPPHDGGRENSHNPVCVPLIPCPSPLSPIHQHLYPPMCILSIAQ